VICGHHGPEVLRPYAMGLLSDEALARRFREFSYSLIAEDRALPDPMAAETPSSTADKPTY